MKGEVVSHLYDNSEYNDSDRCSDKQILSVYVTGQSEDQGKADCSSQASVGQTELVLEIELDGTEGVNDLSQHQNTCREEVKRSDESQSQ